MIAIKKFKQFDKITKYRLENAFLFAFTIGIMMPVLTQLKGLLSITILSVIAIFSKLAMKTNDFFDKKFSLSEIYHLGITLNICFIFSTMLYFQNKTMMILFDSILSIIEFAVFSVFSIKLNYYLSKLTPNSFKEFQKVRNSAWADGTLLGLFITTVLSLRLKTDYIVVLAIFVYMLYVLRLIINWDFFKEINE